MAAKDSHFNRDRGVELHECWAAAIRKCEGQGHCHPCDTPSRSSCRTAKVHVKPTCQDDSSSHQRHQPSHGEKFDRSGMQSSTPRDCVYLDECSLFCFILMKTSAIWSKRWQHFCFMNKADSRRMTLTWLVY